MTHEFIEILFIEKTSEARKKRIQSRSDLLGVFKVNKVFLSCFDDKLINYIN